MRRPYNERTTTSSMTTPFKHRRSIRLPGFDYSQGGAYFVTICSYNRECLFGEIVDGEMRLNETGEMVASCWEELPNHFPGLTTETFIVMPNHVHCVVMFENDPPDVGATHASPSGHVRPGVGATHASPSWENGPKKRSLGAVIGSFKAAATRHINKNSQTPGLPVWQRNYHEHVVRDEEELAIILEYIENNPLKWELDEEHPSNAKSTQA